MKKYRLTKITVKTREIISTTARNAADENNAPVCPLCLSPLVPVLPSVASCATVELLCADPPGDEKPQPGGN